MVEPKGQDHVCLFCAKALVNRWDMGLDYGVFDPQVRVGSTFACQPLTSFVHTHQFTLVVYCYLLLIIHDKIYLIILLVNLTINCFPILNYILFLLFFIFFFPLFFLFSTCSSFSSFLFFTPVVFQHSFECPFPIIPFRLIEVKHKFFFKDIDVYFLFLNDIN